MCFLLEKNKLRRDENVEKLVHRPDHRFGGRLRRGHWPQRGSRREPPEVRQVLAVRCEHRLRRGRLLPAGLRPGRQGREPRVGQGDLHPETGRQQGQPQGDCQGVEAGNRQSQGACAARSHKRHGGPSGAVPERQVQHQLADLGQGVRCVPRLVHS